MKRELAAVAVGCFLSQALSAALPLSLGTATPVLQQMRTTWSGISRISDAAGAESAAGANLIAHPQTTVLAVYADSGSAGLREGSLHFLGTEATYATAQNKAGADQPLSASSSSSSTSTLAPPSPHIASEVQASINGLDGALRVAPAAVAAMGKSVQQHGIAAFLQDDPEVKTHTDELTAYLASGLRALSQAIAKDMVQGAQASGITQSAAPAN